MGRIARQERTLKVRQPYASILTRSNSTFVLPGTSISGKIIIDGTGAESTLTLRDKRENEGYQIAYGVEASVKGEGVGEDRVGDYERDKMTLFDYR